MREDLAARSSSGSSAFWAAIPASIAAPTPPTSGRPPPWMALSYLDWASGAATPTYWTSIFGFFFSKSAMISFQMSVRTPPLLSQKTILPLPLPSAPAAPLPSSPQAVAVRASTVARDIAAATRPRCVLEMFMVGSSLWVRSVLVRFGRCGNR